MSFAVFRQPRGAPRRRVLFGGKLVYGENSAFTADCTIKDISEHGARIQLGKRESIPTHVVLIDLHAGAAFEAEIVWRRAPQFGLRFVRRIDLSNTRKLANHLGQLWGALRQ